MEEVAQEWTKKKLRSVFGKRIFYYIGTKRRSTTKERRRFGKEKGKEGKYRTLCINFYVVI